MLLNFLDWIECERRNGADIPDDYYLMKVAKKIQESFLMNISIPRMLIATMPPRSFKTKLSFNLLPRWILEQFPYRTIGMYSYDEHLVDMRIKELPKVFYYKVNNMNAGTRPPIDVFIVDAFCKNDVEAKSDTINMKIYSDFEMIVKHKLLRNAFILVIGSRWSKVDLVAKIFEHIDTFPCLIDYINIPAISNQFDILDRSPNESYCKERFPLDKLKETQKLIGQQWFEALYQGMPIV